MDQASSEYSSNNTNGIMPAKGETLNYLLDSVHWLSMEKCKVSGNVFTQWRSYNGISLLANNGLPASRKNERT